MAEASSYLSMQKGDPRLNPFLKRRVKNFDITQVMPLLTGQMPPYRVPVQATKTLLQGMTKIKPIDSRLTL